LVGSQGKRTPNLGIGRKMKPRISCEFCTKEATMEDCEECRAEAADRAYEEMKDRRDDY